MRYELVTVNKNWTEAQYHCYERYMELAMISDRTEYLALQAYIEQVATATGQLICCSTLMLQFGGGGYFTPRRSFYPVVPKLLRIVRKVFVTFPEYIWGKNAEKIQISPLVFPILQLENGHPTKESSKILC